MDDFGVGTSSLTRLRDVPLDIVKLDRAFVQPLAATSTDQDVSTESAFLTALVGLARARGLAVVGEGIETAHQAAVLLDAGCTLGQGYLFGRPEPAAALGPLLAASRAGGPGRRTGG